jgi:D-alanine-D-alanine ligase
VVIVFMGGESKEHDVSLRSGAAVVKHLPAAGFDPVPVVIGIDGLFAFPPASDVGAAVERVGLGAAVARMESAAPACAFIALHGPFGEDGRVQALCDLMHVPHVGADAISSAVAIDKHFAKAVYREWGIPTPDAVLLTADDLGRPGAGRARLARLGLPAVVKTPRMGSSFGVSIARTASELEASLAAALALDPHVMVEEFRQGRELTVPVIEDPETGDPRALPVIEIVVKREGFFDYEAKYDPALSDELCPAPIPPEIAAAAQDLGVRAHRALRLSGFSRTDFIWDDKGLWTLETNTIPGLTEVSLFPKAVGVAGMTFSDMLRILVTRALSRAACEDGRP